MATVLVSLFAAGLYAAHAEIRSRQDCTWLAIASTAISGLVGLLQPQLNSGLAHAAVWLSDVGLLSGALLAARSDPCIRGHAVEGDLESC